ncbi:Protein LURP-one-related 11 [Triticum urartu]|uniref:Protein LURP-one-related n=2 Tax=Triticum TaxID=4564 RepID=A0A9R0RSB9_TRITD|nr:Protein LURP-one-related 11 [Triticum urartu]VAH65339.1 unnamed protein product [Triticum turgidum subsp. durum]
MARVHPNMVAAPGAVDEAPASSAVDGPTTLTVWRKSLLFDCKGFTVFDAEGNLAYRVDSYASESGDEPGVGVPLAMAVVVALEQMFARPSLLRSWST